MDKKRESHISSNYKQCLHLKLCQNVVFYLATEPTQARTCKGMY